jgi:hypothetical protein
MYRYYRINIGMKKKIQTIFVPKQKIKNNETFFLGKKSYIYIDSTFTIFHIGFIMESYIAFA